MNDAEVESREQLRQPSPAQCVLDQILEDHVLGLNAARVRPKMVAHINNCEVCRSRMAEIVNFLNRRKDPRLDHARKLAVERQKKKTVVKVAQVSSAASLLLVGTLLWAWNRGSQNLVTKRVHLQRISATDVMAVNSVIKVLSSAPAVGVHLPGPAYLTYPPENESRSPLDRNPEIQLSSSDRTRVATPTPVLSWIAPHPTQNYTIVIEPPKGSDIVLSASSSPYTVPPGKLRPGVEYRWQVYGRAGDTLYESKVGDFEVLERKLDLSGMPPDKRLAEDVKSMLFDDASRDLSSLAIDPATRQKAKKALDEARKRLF